MRERETRALLTFVHKEDCLLPVHPASLLRGRYGRPDVFHPGQDGVDGDEMGLGGVGDDASQRGFARTRRAVENDRGKLVGLDGAPQQSPRPHNRILAHEFIQRARSHTGGQRLLFFQQFLTANIEEVGHERRKKGVVVGK